MNGRAYDYNLGRFLSVDPFIQAPGNSQSMNPYSYIMNNPLAGTDPSGYTANCDVTAMDCGEDESDKPQKPEPEEENGDGEKDEKNKIKLEDLLNRAKLGEKFIIKEKDGSQTTIEKNKKGVISATNDRTGKSLTFSTGGTSDKSLKPTKDEYELVKQGRLAEMWKSRCERGDPIGCVGFSTWGTVDELKEYYGDNMIADYWITLGATVQFNARTGLLEGNPEFFKGEHRQRRLKMTERLFGQAIARTHLKMTERDHRNRPYFLSAVEITRYHHKVFDAFNVSREWYGGSYFDGTHSDFLENFYCIPSCDDE
ncbi:MAG: RHS repeat-associated core domain-containing protein [Flavobacteriaceae bacterium]